MISKEVELRFLKEMQIKQLTDSKWNKGARFVSYLTKFLRRLKAI